jgi:cytochrome c biogenesis protein CcdA
MLLYMLAFAGGILTIVSPCILPVLPFVFSRADQPFRRSGLPLLAGMAFTFALVAAVATFAGAWIVRANQIGRIVAIVIFALLGLTLLFPSLAEILSRPFVRFGGRVQGQGGAAPSVGRSLILGVSTGLLWAPCAGPILGLILTGAAVEGASAHTAFLLLAFAAGAAAALAVALFAGNRVFALMKRSLGSEEWIRRGLGLAVLAGVVAVASGWDTGILRRLSLSGSTSGFEQRLVDRLRPVAYARGLEAPAPAEQVPLDNEGPFPSLDGAVSWLNSPPLTSGGLRGKVVLIDFWTYSCINCLRAIPYVEA